MSNQRENSPVLVLGGTGHYGQHIVQSLLQKGEPVRVLSRNVMNARKILGDEPELIEGDITSKDSIIESLDGVKAIVISVAAFTRKTIRKMELIERDSVHMVLDEALKTGIRRVVYISAYDLKEDVIKKLGIHLLAKIKLDIEATLAKSSLNWTILGAPPSMEIFFTTLRGTTLMFPASGSSTLPTISPLDLGEIAAQTALREDLNGKRFRICCPKPLSFLEAAKHISNVTGKSIKFRRIPLTPIRVASILTRPFNPYLWYLFLSIRLMNNFPPDIIAEVPKDHQLLVETFNYTPTTLEMEARRRGLGL
ncbi:MAG: SDR family oxidoreductase [Candidatus Hodarchaeota archaeon]